MENEDDELRPFTAPINLDRDAGAELPVAEQGLSQRGAKIIANISRLFRSSRPDDAEVNDEEYAEQQRKWVEDSDEEQTVDSIVVPESLRKAGGIQAFLGLPPMADDYHSGDTVSSQSTNPDQGVQLTRTLEKYKLAKRSNYALCCMSATFLVFIIGFVCITYIQMLPGGALTGEQLINPYIADGKLTQSWMCNDCDPCENFLNYSMEGWFDTHPLSTGKGRLSYSFDTAKGNVTKLIKNILEHDWPYLGPFYRSCQALPQEQANRFSNISGWALRISSQQNRSSMFRYLARLRADAGIDLRVLFSLSVMIDPTAPTQHAYSLSSDGFMLPSKPHYNNPATLAFYTDWVTRLFSFIGFTISPQRVDNLVEAERRAAQLGMSVDDLYDPLKTTNYYTYAELKTLMGPSAFAYLQELPLNTSARFIVDDVTYFQNLTLPTLEVLRDLSLVRLLKHTLPLLDLEGQLLISNFSQYFGHAASTDYCQEVTDKYLGWLISQYYTDEVYVESDKVRVAQIWALLKEKLKLLVSGWTWLDDDSREQAVAKYERLEVLAAYPDQWLNFDEIFAEADVVPLRRDSLLDNVVKLERIYDFQLLKSINLPVDRKSWLMTPTAVNAYYEPTVNIIVIPLAIEQEPFLSSHQPYAANLAKFWAVVMHECFHVVDSMGALYDSTGRLIEWMSVYSRSMFDIRVQCIEEQFSEYTVYSSQNHLNGKLVSGEALADLNGLKLCYSLLQEFILTRNATWDQESKWIEDAYGLTMEQLFFVKYAQLWAQQIAPSYALELSRTDPHPLAEYRVLGTLSNMESFANAFGCAAGSKYNPRMKCSMD